MKSVGGESSRFSCGESLYAFSRGPLSSSSDWSVVSLAAAADTDARQRGDVTTKSTWYDDVLSSCASVVMMGSEKA